MPWTHRQRLASRCVLLGLVLTAVACGMVTWNPAVSPADDPPPWAPGAYLKVHMHDGDLYVLHRWRETAAEGTLGGEGEHFDANRASQGSGTFTLPLSEIALLETNEREVVSRFARSGLIVHTVLWGAVTAACLADPKSCFGSCPTFYAADDPERPLAEGFSSSFARVLEAGDVDRLGLRAAPGPVSLVMRNEAFETHAVRSVRLIAAEASAGTETMLTTGGELVEVRARTHPVGCVGSGVDCVAQIRQRDDLEYASRTDSTDLGLREEVVLAFGPVSGDLGLVVSARNSFVTTYAFYQSLAYAGRRAGDLLAALEREEPGLEDRVLGIARALGGIEIFVDPDGRGWRPAGEFNEAGPIAADQQVVRLGRLGSPDLRVMLRMAQGSWRIDELGIVQMGGPASVTTLEPDSVTSGRPTVPDAYASLIDPDRYLVTVPGDAYQLWFTVPDGATYDLFLDSRGYYYEWMREAWLGEEDAVRTASIMLDPAGALRDMAPGFKQLEADFEQLFWASRYRR